MNSQWPTCLLLAVLLGSAALRPAFTAEILRWQDADGKTHFGDRAPPGARATPVAPQPVNAARPVPVAPASATPGATVPAADVPPAAPTREACERARREVVVLATQRPIYRDESGELRVKRGPGRPDVYGGERRYLDDHARSAAQAAAEQAFARDCAAWPDLQNRQQAEADLFRQENCENARAALADANQRGFPPGDDPRPRFAREIAQWCTSP